MDYLKNIVLQVFYITLLKSDLDLSSKFRCLEQYMKLPIAAPERMSLVPVISTLLQFSKTELEEAQGAMKVPMWSSLPVKEVKRMTLSPTPKIIGQNRVTSPSAS